MYIVIEKSTGDNWIDASIVTDEDGINRVFNTIEEAQREADDCQDGIIVGDEVVTQTDRDELSTAIGQAIAGLIEFFTGKKMG